MPARHAPDRECGTAPNGMKVSDRGHKIGHPHFSVRSGWSASAKAPAYRAGARPSASVAVGAAAPNVPGDAVLWLIAVLSMRF
jgi:hypothetical protein